VRPTNNAGGLEGGVTNGRMFASPAFMKPIATLMKPLRSVDLNTLHDAPAPSNAATSAPFPPRRSSAKR
jgi:chorismate synthase